MTKTDAAAKLTNAGYVAEVENGVVCLKEPVNRKQQDAVRKLLADIGYRASVGWKEG